MKVSVIRKLTDAFWRFITRKMKVSTQRVLWLVVGEAILFKRFIAGALLFNILAALLEGVSVAAMAMGVSVVVSAESAICDGSIPWLSNFGFQGLCEDYAKTDIFLFLLGVAVVGQIVRAVFQYIATVFAAYLQTNVVGSLQKKVIKQLMSLSYEQKSLYSAGEQQAYISQAAKTASLVNVINTLVMNIFVFFFYVLILIGLSWKLSLGSMLLIVILTVMLQPFLSKIQKIGRRILVTGIELAKTTVEYLQASRLVRVYNKEVAVTQKMNEIIETSLKARRDGMIIQGILNPLQESIAIVSGVAFLASGFYFSNQPLEQVLPLLMAYVLVLYRTLGKLSIVNVVRSGIAKVTPSAEHVAELLRNDNKTIIRTAGETVAFDGFGDFNAAGLQVEDLSYQYNSSESLVLDHVNLTIEPGKTYAFIGPSGSGKTTLVDLLLGLYDPSEGEVSMGGVSLTKANLSEWMRQFAVVSQHDLILNDTVENNLRFAKSDASHEEIVAACKAAQAYDFIMNTEHGFDSILGERGNKLSGGQMQRLALARALLRDAPILVLDEATSALDTNSEKLIMESIMNLRGEKSILMIAHRLSTIVDADMIFVMQDGRVIDQGDHNALMSREGLYKKLWTIQTQARTKSH